MPNKIASGAPKKTEIILSGSGGQGVITAAIIYAEAAVSEGKEVVQSQSYGPEARGGAARSEVIVSDNPIYHPHVETPDILLAMTQAAADKYISHLKDDGILVVDTELVPNPPAGYKTISVPITSLAVEKLGKPLFANIVALGVLTRLSSVVHLDTVKKAVASRVPPHTVEQNMLALQLGYDATEE